jgi:hypothetical protein
MLLDGRMAGLTGRTAASKGLLDGSKGPFASINRRNM